jgi:hypothetical protein
LGLIFFVYVYHPRDILYAHWASRIFNEPEN